MTDPRIIQLLAQKPKIVRTYDLPYVGGYSVDGKTIYIDRHFKLLMPLGHGKTFNVLPFLVLHEHLEKSIIDVFGWSYQEAHAVAEFAEDQSVRAAGISPKQYENYYKPFIKADAKEKLVRVPQDLDLKPYIDSKDWSLLAHLRAKMGQVSNNNLEAKYGIVSNFAA